ncbi:regulator of G-protein signaling 21-like [Oncorhynchus nerka]|uniref:regulator of G-protein signaling 21-like n=1 Tax=Oncorhynchus nerka TaxID=8023 RepID=UPI001131BA9E|nr:regulator of G-protein signaling 21-like [Oncorhynchus nerka]
MPKLLFSKIRIYELKDIPQKRTQRRRIDILLSRKRQKKDIQCILAQKINDESFSTKINPEDNRGIQPTLETLLKDERCLAAFRAFLRSEFSEENIEFWLACRDYRKTTSPADLFWKATEIYQEFLHPQAQREINVDHHIHEKIKRSMKAPALCCFDEAVRHVYKLMESDSYSRFLRSDAYLGLGRKARTFW